jgi:dTDP-4-dehydrorhamnose reductase
MEVFIVGASGLVGSNMLRHFSEQGWNVTGSYFSYPSDRLVYYNTLQPDDSNNWDVHANKPKVIVHCGALTHVDYCEQHPDESYEKTVQSTMNVIKVANQVGAQMVYLSTDYVFDGVDGPYAEDAEVNPISVYGRHKLEAEQSVLAMVPNSLVLRVTNVYGDEARGKNFVSRIVQQCEAGTALTLKLPYDQFAHPTNAWDIAGAAAVLIRDEKRGIYHIGSTDYMNRVELALRILKRFPATQYTLDAVSTESLAQPAGRPLNGGFIRQKFCSEYPEFTFSNLDDYLGRRNGQKDGDTALIDA